MDVVEPALVLGTIFARPLIGLSRLAAAVAAIMTSVH